MAKVSYALNAVEPHDIEFEAAYDYNGHRMFLLMLKLGKPQRIFSVRTNVIHKFDLYISSI